MLRVQQLNQPTVVYIESLRCLFRGHGLLSLDARFSSASVDNLCLELSRIFICIKAAVKFLNTAS